jgi:FixJ family two-component response regulator
VLRRFSLFHHARWNWLRFPIFGSSVELPETDMVRMQQRSGGGVRVHDPAHDAERRVHCVYVIDDDQSMRATLSSLFRSVDLGVELFESAAEFLSHNRSDGRSCLVLDIRLPGVNGLDFQEQLQNAGIRIPIVFMTGHGDIPMSVRAMKAGAVDFLAKPFRDQDMLDAVNAALRRDEQARDTERLRLAVQESFARLSQREREIMELVTSGLMNKQVAGRLGLQVVTVKAHRGSVMKKMNAKSLADLVRMSEMVRLRPGRLPP